MCSSRRRSWTPSVCRTRWSSSWTFCSPPPASSPRWPTALGKAREAAHVFAGSLLNGEAVVDRIERTFPNETVLLVCAGSADNFNLEDFYGAGYLVSLFARHGKARELSDAALAAQHLHDGADAFDCLASSRVGRMMLA